MLTSKIVLIGFLFGSLLLASQDAQTIIKDNGCFACHGIKTKKRAPSFAAIANRNKRFEGENAQANIMNSIQNGSHGKYPHFSDNAMPFYDKLSQEELRIVADYILAQSSKMQNGGGIPKSFRMNTMQKDFE